MSQPVLLKVYANFTPCADDIRQELDAICGQAIASEDDHPPFVTMLDDMVRLSFEGIYFPVEDVVPVLERLAQAGAQGKLDVLDMENWRLTRYVPDHGRLLKKSASLNQVLDYSGH